MRAGVAAGMTVIGLCAGPHLPDGHAGIFTAAGAAHTARTWHEVQEIVAPMLAS